MPSCKKKTNDTPANSAQVMYVHGCAGAETLYGTANNTQVTGATSLNIFKSSGYQYVTAGSVGIGFTVAGINTVLAAGTKSLTVGAHYSAFAGGLLTNPSLVFATDDLTAPASGKAGIRFVNLSPDAYRFAVNVGGAVTDSGITSQSVTAFRQVAAGSVNVRIGDPTNLNTVVDAGSRQLSSGKLYTLMLTGTSGGSGAGGYTLTMIQNN